MAVRLAERDPFANWSCFKRSALLYHVHLAGVGFAREEREHVWRTFVAFAVYRARKSVSFYFFKYISFVCGVFCSL
jgi:hypothetical protein